PIAELPEVARRAHDAGARIVGLQAHVGSGVFDVTSWEHTARLLAAAAQGFAQLRVIDVGGGLGVPERPDQPGVDLARLDALLLAVRADEPATELVNVVGPICESADVLGHDRLLPVTREGDVLVIANAGAYGHAMSSQYNLRAPATELFI